MTKSFMQNKNIEWNYISYSDVNTIRGLLKFRYKFDLLFDRSKENLLASDFDLVKLNEDIICVYADLDKLIEKANLNDIQKKVIRLYMKGYTERDISELLNKKISTINGIINSVCKKIVKINNELWKYDYLYWNVVKVDSNFKQCSRCKEWLPATRNFFGYHPNTKDKLQSVCKKCDSKRKHLFKEKL